MEKSLNTIVQLMAGMGRGVIYIDHSGDIEAYSRLAKEITGIVLKNEHVHPAGKINEGDIVILGDNDIGNDDELEPSDLKCLNINDPNIKKGGAIVAIGVYGNKKITPVYKVVNDYNPNGTLGIDTVYLGFKISVEINFSDDAINIRVNDNLYKMPYIDAIGHMVVIDGISGQIKFFQDIGYGFREEEIGRLLRQKCYMAKEKTCHNEGMINTIGVKYDKILSGTEICTAINEMLAADYPVTKEGVFEVHKRALFCTMIRLVGYKQLNGLFLIIQDAMLMEKTLERRKNLILDLEAGRKTRMVNLTLEDAGYMEKQFIGSTPAMNEVKRLAIKASKANFNVLITGESGTGKTKLARLIHDIHDSNAPFVEVNCNAIAPTLLESELFGYVGGAFTGAKSSGKAGFFEEANGGTIFLDEIGDISLDVQVKLLQVLQSKKIYRVGSSKPVDVDVRVITATNKDLAHQVRIGAFRQDLYYRINVFPIYIPPIRERKNDLYVLINSLLKSTCDKYKMDIKQLSEGALKKIMSYDWPGNVRELENVIERSVIMCDSHIIYTEHISIDGDEYVEDFTLKELLKKEELRIINETLLKNNGDKKATMRELGISKTSFYEKIKE